MTWDYRNFLGTQFLQKSLERQEEILFFRIIIKGLVQKLVKAFVRFVELYVHVQPVLINLINIFYQLLLHHINQDIPLLKIVTIKK